MENDRLTTANQFLDCGGLTHFILNFFVIEILSFNLLLEYQTSHLFCTRVRKSVRFATTANRN